MKIVNGTRTCIVTAAFAMGLAGAGITPARGAVAPAEKLEPRTAVTEKAPSGHDRLAPRDAIIVIAKRRAVPGRAPVQRHSHQRARNNGTSGNRGGSGHKPKQSRVFKPSTDSNSKGPMYMMPLNCVVQPQLCF